MGGGLAVVTPLLPLEDAKDIRSRDMSDDLKASLKVWVFSCGFTENLRVVVDT